MSLEERKAPADDSGAAAHQQEHLTIPLMTPSRIGWSEAHSHRDRPHLRRDPLRVYAIRAFLFDLLAVITAGVVGFILRWAIPYSVELNNPTYVSLVLVVIVSWMAVLVLRGAYDTRMLGVGSEEFKRVVGASAMVFAAIAVLAFAFTLDLSRGFVLITFAVGLNGCVTSAATGTSCTAPSSWVRGRRRTRSSTCSTVIRLPASPSSTLSTSRRPM
ncbi:MAG: hypothetical protein NTX29_03365 [Actinobacteria bacterium]|nr:hypothetical protein [Actinomycetota bacterium]